MFRRFHRISAKKMPSDWSMNRVRQCVNLPKRPGGQFGSDMYKKFRESCEDLKDCAKSLKDKEAHKLTDMDRTNLIDALNKVADKGTAYQKKKQGEMQQRAMSAAENQKKPKNIDYLDTNEQAKYTAASTVTTMTTSITNMYNKTMDAPINYIRHKLDEVHKNNKKLSGEKLRDSIAEEIYFKSLEKTDRTTQSQKKFKLSLGFEAIEQGKNSIKNTPGFRELTQLPDTELQKLANDGNKLMSAFFKESAKAKQASSKKQKFTERKKQIDDLEKQQKLEKPENNIKK